MTGIINPALDDDDYSPGDGAILDVGAAWGLEYDDITDVVIPGDYAGGNEGEAEITYTGEQEVSDQVESTSENTISKNPESYQTPGLQSVFPFCIPFDLYNFVACLAADPVAPSFTWRFYVPGICDEELEIDLSEFNTAAQILRTMELLAFCVGLAFVTRKIIRGDLMNIGDAFKGLIQNLINVLPTSPFAPFVEQFSTIPFLGYLNWFSRFEHA